MPAVNADELMDAGFKDRTMRETQAGRATTQHETVSDDIHPRIPVLFAKMRPAVVIIGPSQLLSGLMPGGLLHAAPCGSLLTPLSDRTLQIPLDPDVEL
jgi:hypothetical protein